MWPCLGAAYAWGRWNESGDMSHSLRSVECRPARMMLAGISASSRCFQPRVLAETEMEDTAPIDPWSRARSESMTHRDGLGPARAPCRAAPDRA